MSDYKKEYIEALATLGAIYGICVCNMINSQSKVEDILWLLKEYKKEQNIKIQ